MAENLKLYFEGQLAMYRTMRANASAELAQTNDELSQARIEQAILVKASADMERNIAATREAMADDSLMPADVEVLAGELRNLLIEQREQRVDMLAQQDRIGILEDSRDAFTSRLALLDTQLADIASDLEQAKEEADIHQSWAERISEGDIDDLKAGVAGLLAIIDGGALDPEAAPELVAASVARARIEDDVPAILRAHAEARGDWLDSQMGGRQAQLTTLKQLIASQQATYFGASGMLAQAWLAYGLAEQAYADVVARGESRVSRAQALLHAIAESPALTQAEQDRIAAVALEADDDALVKEQARDAAQAAVVAKVVEIEAAISAALVADINADPEANAQVIARRSELEGLETALNTAEGEFDAAMQQALDLWQGAVPDVMWRNLVNYNKAVSMLRALDAADVNALGTAFSDAETALVGALAEEEQALRLVDILNDRANRLERRVAALNAQHNAQLLSAVRGDAGYHASLVQGEIL